MVPPHRLNDQQFYAFWLLVETLLAGSHLLPGKGCGTGSRRLFTQE